MSERSDTVQFSRLTSAQVSDYLSAARASLAAGVTQFDLGGLQQVDSSALAALVAISREASQRCEFRNPPDSLVKLARLYDVAEMLFDIRQA